MLDYKGNRLNLTLVQYITSSDDEVEIKPHGNATSSQSQPYLRTSTSTLKAIKSKLQFSSPKEALEKVSKERGGEILAKSTGDLPRNRQQVYNKNKQQKTQDPLYSLIVEIQNLGGSGEDQFIRELKLAPEPSVILSYDYQLAEVEAFCTYPGYHCVFGIDPTFNLGQFNLTVTTYKQLQLVKSTGEHPTFVGPLFLHYRKNFSCYNSFSSGLTGLNKNLSNIRAFGTDGETALIEAFQQQCRNAVHLTCFTHCRENIKRKLRELNVPSDAIKEYLFEIFGGQRDTTFVEGLADSTFDSDFDEKLAAIEITWNAREKALSSSPQFFTYFTKYKAPVFKESMIASVREKAGLGHPPKEYHNNGPECINNVIKMKVKRERSVLDEFCSKMKSLAEDLQNHLLRAITRRGEYRLHPYFKEYEMDSSQWFKLDQNARTDHLHRLRSAAKKLKSKRDDKTGAAVPPSLPEKSSCTEG